MKTNIGITKKNTQPVATALAKVLSDTFILATKTLNAHWNVEGADFYNKHLFFETQYQLLYTIIDDTAERIRALGHYAPATLQAFLSLTHLSEISREKNDSEGFIKELLADHESIIIHLRENIRAITNDCKDVGTGNFISNLFEKHEKMAWCLRAHLS